MMGKKGVIYCLTNNITGKKYIGQTVSSLNRRINRHFSAKSAISNALRKYGLDNFKIEVLSSDLCVKCMNYEEYILIKTHNTMYPNGYNLKEGGLQPRLSKISIDKIRKKNSGKKEKKIHTEKRMKKIRKPVMCLETKKKFDSVKSASSFYNIDPSHLSKQLKGKTISNKGYKFVYLDKLSGGALSPS